jgi:signal transduction histidine kinase/GAF domain-containing protein
MVLGPYFGDYRSAYRFSQLSVDLVDKRGLDASAARVYMNLGNGNTWTRNVRSSRAFVQRAFDAANKVGDLIYAGHCYNNLVTISLASGEPLSDVDREAVTGLAFVRKVQFGIVVDMITGQLRLIRMLRGLTSEFTSFNDTEFDEAQFEQHLDANPNLALSACFYWIRKLQAYVWANDHRSALGAAAKAQKVLWTSRWFLEHAEYHFYAGLAHAASCNVVPATESDPHLKSLATHHRQLEIWAQHCPENFADRGVLLAAEIARLEGRALDAERLYEDAIRLARENGFVQNEALANELAARFYAARNFATIADSYIRKARDCCLRWGAEGKVRQLEQSHPHLRDEAAPTRLMTTMEAPQQQLDLAAVVKIYQTVSGEIVLEKLIETLMVIAVEHAGAERGLLVLPQGGQQRIEAEATTARDTVIVRLLGMPATPSELPDSVLQYVIRTQDSVILDDASARNPFSADPYIGQKHARSVLCLPLVKQAKLIGTLYLENNLASHVFTPARISVLKLLASQAAISIENARLYAELTQENRDRRKAEDDLRRSEASLTEAQRISHTGSWRWNVRTGEVSCSIELFRVFGFDPVTTQPSYATFKDRIHPEDRPSVEQVLDQAVRERSRFQNEYRIALPDGEVKYLQSVGQPDSTVSDSLEFVGTVMDITERRRADEALRNAQSELVRVARLTTMGELVASIAHEINQPLAGVAASGSACLRWLKGDKPDLDAACESVSRIVRDAHRASDVIRSLRALTEKSGPQPTPLDINDAIQEILALTGRELQQRGVALRTDLSVEVRSVFGDRVQLQQVLLNLITNAVDAMSTVMDRARELTVSSALTERGGSLVKIVDTGEGLDPTIAQRIFEPFFTTKSDGLGMGLSICRSIIESHGGELWVAPNVPHGTVFRFTVPEVPPA